MYKLFHSRLDNLLDATGFSRILPWRDNGYREFWALRGLYLQVPRGQRLGIIGCNGAGKTTLLKLIAGRLSPTTGSLSVAGQVQALMTTGAGFHPEFTGRENIDASLVYQGLSRSEIRAAIDEIEEFTELGEFLDQPFKTYSAGMQARLTFATATTVRPDILLIDEILGAGDGYFISKSMERVSKLVNDSGATIVLVSHALDMTVRFCEEAIWLDAGRIVEKGAVLEVVKSYERHLRQRNERRIKAKNRVAGSILKGVRERIALGYFAASLTVRVTARGKPGARCDVSELALREENDVQERLLVGDAQDTNSSRPAFIVLSEDSAWSSPREDGRSFRSLVHPMDGERSPAGRVHFSLYSFHGARHSLEITYRAHDVKSLTVELSRDGRPGENHSLPVDRSGWMKHAIDLDGTESEEKPSFLTAHHRTRKRSLSVWECEGPLVIEEVLLIDENGRQRGIFDVGEPMSLCMSVKSSDRSTLPVIPTASIYRIDGVTVSRHVGQPLELDFSQCERRTLRFDWGPLNLGNGCYVLSCGLFRSFDWDRIEDAQPYQIIDRSYEFEVKGNPPHKNAIFQHPGEWRAL